MPRLKQSPGLRDLIVLLFIVIQGAAAHAEQPIRKIAPDSFPNYGSRATASQPQAEMVPASREKPTGNCRIEDRAWALCLNKLSESMDHAVQQEVENVSQRLMAREDAADGRKMLWAKSLTTAQSRWKSLRDEDCGVLSTAESGPYKEFFEHRAVCSIYESILRIEDLRRRFP